MGLHQPAGGCGQDVVFHPADQGMVGGQVPGAELFAVRSPATELYYNVTPNSFELQSYYGIVPYDLVANHLFEYNPPLPERHAPMNFFDIRSSTSGVVEYLLPSDFSPLLMTNLAAETNNVIISEMRYRVAISQIYAVDGWTFMQVWYLMPYTIEKVLMRRRIQTNISVSKPKVKRTFFKQNASTATHSSLYTRSARCFDFSCNTPVCIDKHPPD